MRLRAIVTRDKMTLQLLKKSFSIGYDSIHGDFKVQLPLDPENNALIINGYLFILSRQTHQRILTIPLMKLTMH
jgi:hypothetical protein